MNGFLESERMKNRHFAIFGTGGLAREVMQMLRRDMPLQPVFVEDDPHCALIDCIPVYQTEAWFELTGEKHHCIAVGDPQARSQIASRFALQGSSPFSYISRKATIVGTGILGPGCIIMDGARISHNFRIYSHFIANYNAVIGHDCSIQSCVTIGPGAHLNGYTRIGECVNVGSNAALINGIKESPLTIGNNAIIGLGAVVLRNVPEGKTAVGNPARILEK